VLEGIVGDALALRLAYHPGQRVHYRVILSQRLEDVWKDQRPNFGFSAECGSGAPTSLLLGHYFLGALTVRVVKRARSERLCHLVIMREIRCDGGRVCVVKP
jgi:hypothetical protein